MNSTEQVIIKNKRDLELFKNDIRLHQDEINQYLNDDNDTTEEKTSSIYNPATEFINLVKASRPKSRVFTKFNSCVKQFHNMKLKDLYSMNEYQLLSCFQYYDEDCSGTLDKQEVMNMGVKMGLSIRQSENLFFKIDINGDGEITDNEWVGYFLESQEKIKLKSKLRIDYEDELDYKSAYVNNSITNQSVNNFSQNQSINQNEYVNNQKVFDVNFYEKPNTQIDIYDQNVYLYENESNTNRIDPLVNQNKSIDPLVNQNKSNFYKQNDQIDKLFAESDSKDKLLYYIDEETNPLCTYKIKKTESNCKKLMNKLKNNEVNDFLILDPNTISKKFNRSPGRINKKPSLFASMAYNLL